MKHKKYIIFIIATTFVLSGYNNVFALTRSSDEYYDIAVSLANKPYQSLNIYTEAHNLYPDDNRFVDGINNSAITILKWSINSHKEMDFDAAIYGYNTIISSSADYYIRQAAVRNKELAMDKRSLLTANEYYNLSLQYNKVSPYESLGIYYEAKLIYPNDERFVQGINDSAATILSWSKNSHKNGDFTSAINGYRIILNISDVSEDITKESKKYLELATNKEVWYTANEYYNMMMKLISNNPYKALNMNIEAKNLYPSDERFVQGINDSAATILSWSKNSHKNGDFTSAINGYQTVFNASNIDASLKNEAAALLTVAKSEQPYNSDGKYVINTYYNSTFQEALDKQIKYGQPLTDLYGKGIDGSYWQVAKKEDISYYLNPDNFLDENNIYQFLKLSGQAGINETELNNVLLNKGILQGKARYFMEASIKYNINEIYLISHSLLETGNGTSSLAKGVSYGGKTVYNMYGVGAYDRPFYSSDGDKANPTAWGAKYAYEHAWFTPEAAIVGGAAFIGEGYINAGQDTLYKMKWNPESPATHQYATDIRWAVKQINSIKSLYDRCKNYILRFDIPIYKK